MIGTGGNYYVVASLRDAKPGLGETGPRGKAGLGETGPREGAVLAAVLVGLLAVMMIAAALAQTLVLQHRQARRSAQSQQSFWLAESAVQRAVHQLATSPDYAGETWRVALDVPGGDGVAIIRVKPADDAPETRHIMVEAYYPEELPDRVLYRRQWTVHLPSDPGGSS